MPDADHIVFDALKRSIATTLQKSHAVSSENISAWKGQDIIHLQDDLEDKVNQRISEKWFYTHLKATHDKLPRIDMLNLLSEYVGSRDWATFKQQHAAVSMDHSNHQHRNRKRWVWVGIPVLLIIAVSVYAYVSSATTHRFCFIDSDHNDGIRNGKIELEWIREGESSRFIQADSSACFELKTREDMITFVVRSPYYKTDTITRIIGKRDRSENVKLRPNDYALMIHLFSTSKVEDWRKRRAQLDEMLADNAKIYQVYEADNIGMELFNKQEFINKLTMPLRSLKNIEIIETIYTGDQITSMRFKQTTKNE